MRLNLTHLMIVLMYGMVLVDMLTGALLIKNPELTFTPGILYKILLLALLFYFLPRLNPWVMVANFLLFSTTIISSLLSGINSIPTNIITATKFLMFLTFFYYLIFLLKKQIIYAATLYKIAVFTYVVLIINQILGLIGFGKPTYLLYGVPVGTSGFFFEHNATGIILLIVSAIIYMYQRNKMSNLKLLAFIALTILIGFSLATKVAILGSLIIALLAFYDRFKKYTPIAFTILSILVITNLEFIQNTGQIAKVIDDLDKNQSEGLLSGRLTRFEKGIDDYFIKFTGIEKLIGIGSYRLLNDPLLGESAEIDFIDILKISGVIGFLVIYIPFFWISYQCFYYYRKYRLKEFAIVLFLNIVFLIISSTAGHLFPSGSVTFYLALINAYPFYILKRHIDSLLV